MSAVTITGGTISGTFLRNLLLDSQTRTLAAGLTMTTQDSPLQMMDPGGSGRTIVLPAEADSEGLSFLVYNSADNAEDLTFNDDAAVLVGVIGQNEAGLFACDGTTWRVLITGIGAGLAAADVTVADVGGFFAAAEVEAALQELGATTGAAIIGLADSGAFTSAATVEAALAEIYQHILSAQSFIPLSLMQFREATAFDVSNIAANGGILASDTTPVLDAINAATDGAQRLLWASSNNDQVITQIALPPDLDVAKDIVVHLRIVSGGTTNAVGFTLASFFNEGDSSIADTSGTNQTTTYAEVIATIAAADIPAGAQTLSLGLTPVAHTTDTLALGAVWLEYSKLILTS